MKKLFTFFAIISMSFNCFAQLQNGGFELWNSTSADMPTGWVFTNNKDALEIGMAPTASKYTPAHGGNFAAKIETIISTSDTLMGVIGNSIEPFLGEGGVPYSMQPDSFFCWAQLGIQPLDTALFLIIFKNGGSMIGMDLFSVSENTPGVWQRLAFKLSPLPMTPDSVIIVAASSNAMTNQGVQNGSYLILDDMSFNTSQAIPGGDFEDWGLLSIEHPQTYNNPNTLWILNDLEAPISKTTDSYSGNYALKMKTLSSGMGFNFVGFSNGTWNPQGMNWMGGFQYNLQVDTLIGWYKYTPKVSGRQAQLRISFRAGGVSISEDFLFLPEASTYTLFEFPFNLSQAPDSAVFQIKSNDTPFNIADTGSVLIIDEVQFKSNPITATKPAFAKVGDVLVAPNPSTGEFSFLYLPQNVGSVSYTLFDSMGRLVRSGNMGSAKTTLNISDSEKGIYFLNIKDGNRTISKKIVLQ